MQNPLYGDTGGLRLRQLLIVIIFFLVNFLLQETGFTASNQEEDIGPPGPDEVHIGPNGVIMPLENILLVRKGTDYCVVKFIEFRTGESKEDKYARYESYCQDDKSGNFSKANVKFKREELFSPKPRWFLFGHPVAFGAKKEIYCGFIKLWWTGKGTVYFFERYQPQGDYGIELAPTKWTHISQVNVFDPRLKWLRYDENRKRVNIPVDDLWEDN